MSSLINQNQRGLLAAVPKGLALRIAYGLMVVVVICQGIGLVSAAALRSFQGSFSIVLVGTTIVLVVTTLKKGLEACDQRLSFQALLSRDVWLEGLRTLRWSNFTREEKWAIGSLALTSAFINIGGPTAVRLIGNGQYAAMATFAGLAAGILSVRFLPQWLTRGAVLIAVVFAAAESGQASFSLLGYVAGAFAASHLWNLPKRVVRLGAKRDEGLTVANLISAPFVLIGTWGWDHSQGVSWEWGTKEIICALCAGILMMVIPVFLQNMAGALGMPETDMGTMSALSSPVHASLGLILSPVTMALTGKAPILPTQAQWGFYCIVAVVALAVPLMPKDNSWRPKKAGPDAAVREDGDSHDQPPAPLVTPKRILSFPEEPSGPLGGAPARSMPASQVGQDNPWVRPAGGTLQVPAWVIAQRVSTDGDFFVSPAGPTKLTAEGSLYADKSGFTYRKGNLSVVIQLVGGGTHSDRSFKGSWARGISVVIDGAEVLIPDTGEFCVNLDEGTLVLVEAGVTFVPGGVRAAE